MRIGDDDGQSLPQAHRKRPAPALLLVLVLRAATGCSVSWISHPLRPGETGAINHLVVIKRNRILKHGPVMVMVMVMSDK